MGAWGSGPFENDGAVDLLASIRAGEFSFDELGWAFEDDYLEVDGGQIALALVDLSLVGLGVRNGPPSSDLTGIDLGPFLAGLSRERLAWVVSVADRTLSGSEASELYELWEETDELDTWLRSAEESVGELKAYQGRGPV
ncbi:DUF4259 domain-containing protein [Sanguibacter sp. 25GB23B1]|uniref:DUF4259 domain-containing protein n=1 Tax=unclassified Sanguibacter TaxID=2645534 RepID=UPI0032AF94FF